MNHEDQELRRDASVVASDGPVGHVSHVIVDRSTNTVTEIVVEHGGQAWLVPYDAVAAVEDNVVRLHTSWSDAPVEAFDRGEFRAARPEPNTVLDAYSSQGTPGRQDTQAVRGQPVSTIVIERTPVRREGTNEGPSR